MRVLLDNCVDVRLRDLILEHDVVHVLDIGWESMSNGNLLSKAEANGFHVFITVDKNLRHQQNFADRKISLISLNPLLVTFQHLMPLVSSIQALLDGGIDRGSVLLIP